MSDLGELELALGNPAAANERFEAAAAASFSSGHRRRWTSAYVSGGIEALAALDRLEDASRALDQFETEAVALGRRPDLAGGAPSARSPACGGGRAADAVGPLTEAVERYQALDDRWGLARTLLLLGEVHRRSRTPKRARAVESLTQALAEFNRFGARIWADRGAGRS